MSSPIRFPRTFPAALVAALLVAAALAPLPARAQPGAVGPPSMATPSTSDGTILDQGTFIVAVRGEPIRSEDFLIQRLPDTLVVRAASRMARAGQEPGPYDKNMIFVVGPYDFALGNYSSWQATSPDTLKRGVQVSPRDTVMTVWRQYGLSGRADLVLQPPGRMYILDPPLFTVFNYLGWSLNGKVCDHRPVNVFVLGERDSMVQSTVTDLGNETIRWGGRSVLARKLLIADSKLSFTGWYSLENGRMYRLEQALADIRVERKPPPVKRAAPRRK